MACLPCGLATCEALHVCRPCERLGDSQRFTRACFHARPPLDPADRPPRPPAVNDGVRGFILPWSLPLRRTLAFHLAVTFRIPHSLSGFFAPVADVPKPRSGVGRRSVTVQGFDPSPTAAETLIALRFPPCRWTRTLTGKPAATLFTLDFEVLIRLGDPSLPLGCPSGRSRPLFRFPLSG